MVPDHDFNSTILEERSHPWPLQAQPLLHFSKRQDMVAWPPIAASK